MIAFHIHFFLVGPQIGAFSFGDETLNAGDMASAICAVNKGDLPLEIVWMFNQQPIDVKQRTDIVISESSKRTKQLTIDSVGAQHVGEYTCVASNIAGSTSRSAELSVNGSWKNINYIMSKQ